MVISKIQDGDRVLIVPEELLWLPLRERGFRIGVPARFLNRGLDGQRLGLGLIHANLDAGEKKKKKRKKKIAK